MIISYFLIEKKKKKRKRTREDTVQPDFRREDDIEGEPKEAWTSKIAPSKECQVSSSLLELEMGEPREAWTLKQPTGAKAALVTKLTMIGKYFIDIDF